jgi:hypothetical protein
MGRVNHRVAQAATANKTQVDQVQMTAVKGRSRIDCATSVPGSSIERFIAAVSREAVLIWKGNTSEAADRFADLVGGWLRPHGPRWLSQRFRLGRALRRDNPWNARRKPRLYQRGWSSRLGFILELEGYIR